MEIKGFKFLGTFLLLSYFLPYLTSSYSTPNIHSTPMHNRRVLSTNPKTIQQFLVPQNRIRAKLHLTPLQWSEKLANFANSWANHRKGDCELIHSNTNYGENIFWGSGKDWTPTDAVRAWAAEKRYYNYGKNKCLGKDCLHYTQIVWKQSMRVGCAKVTCRSGDTFITCNYDPHGNVIGQKPF